MKESKGKKVVREFFYQTCIPEWLAPEQIRAGSYLLLLGEDARELPLLDKLGVPRGNVWSVECELPVYQKQYAHDFGVSLYYGEMADYLRMLLHSNQRFQVLNLDTEGSYYTQLDPAMTSVILYAWRNKETVIATYSSIGRDTEMLWEGIKSLAVFTWLAPEETPLLMEHLSARYAAAGFTQPFRMALRDLFWIRSIMEHTFVGAGIVGVSEDNRVRSFFALEDMLWAGIADLGAVPLRYGDIEDGARAFQTTHGKVALPVTSLRPTALCNLSYNAVRPWSQTAKIMKLTANDNGTLLTPQSWILQMLRVFRIAPLVYVNRTGEVSLLSESIRSASEIPEHIVWPDARIWKEFKPRHIPLGSRSDELSIIRLKSTSVAAGKKKEPPKVQEPQKMVTGHLADDTGQVTGTGKQIIQKLGSGRRITAAERTLLVQSVSPEVLDRLVSKRGMQQPLGTREICELLPRNVNDRVIRALIAVSRR